MKVVWGIAEDVADWLKHPSLFGAELSVTKGKSQHPCQALATLKPEYFTPKRVADLQDSSYKYSCEVRPYHGFMMTTVGSWPNGMGGQSGG